MKTEWEVRFLEIDEKEFTTKLKSVGAKLVGSWFQIRNIYDFNPKREYEWIRLRTNGQETTLTIKEIKFKGVGGINETEIVVSDFETTNLLLNKLGYNPRCRQENKRTRYILDGIEIDIDKWPTIPAYVEIEAPNKESIDKTCKKLDLDITQASTDTSIDFYLKKYGADANKDLVFQKDK